MLELKQFKVESPEGTFYMCGEDKYHIIEKLSYLNHEDAQFNEKDYKIKEVEE